MSDAGNQNQAEKDERPYRVTRRANLAQLVAEEGGVTKFALVVETPKTHISAMLKGSRNVGDELATKIEQKLEKPHGWMDENHSAQGAQETPLRPDATPVTILEEYLQSINPLLLPSARDILHKMIDGAIQPDDAFHDLGILQMMTKTHEAPQHGTSALDLSSDKGTMRTTKFATR